MCLQFLSLIKLRQIARDLISTDKDTKPTNLELSIWAKVSTLRSSVLLRLSHWSSNRFVSYYCERSWAAGDVRVQEGPRLQDLLIVGCSSQLLVVKRLRESDQCIRVALCRVLLTSAKAYSLNVWNRRLGQSFAAPCFGRCCRLIWKVVVVDQVRAPQESIGQRNSVQSSNLIFRLKELLEQRRGYKGDLARKT